MAAAKPSPPHPTGATAFAASHRGFALPALDIEFVPTPEIVVAKMLEAANLREDDVVYDLGCGDGRLVVEAAVQYGTRGVGFDLDPVRIAEARANVLRAGVGDLVTIEARDLFTVDVRPASVVMLYLLPCINVRLVPQLRQLAPGSRIISHDFDMKGFDYDEVWTLVAKHHQPRPKERDHHVFKWTTPLERSAPVAP